MSQHSVKDRRFNQIVKSEKAKCHAAKGKCWLCHRPIDCTLPSTENLSFSLDHITSPRDAPELKYSLSNLKWAHRKCNSARGDGHTGKVFTTRRW